MKKNFFSAFSILFLVLVTLASCKKEKEDVEQPDTDLAEAAQGSYEMYYIKTKSVPYNLPQNGVSGTVYVNRSAENKVDLRIQLRITETGESPEETMNDIALKEENRATAMYSGQDKIGTIDGDELEISGTDGEGQDLIIRARK